MLTLFFLPITLLATTTPKMGVCLTSHPISDPTGKFNLPSWINLVLR